MKAQATEYPSFGPAVVTRQPVGLRLFTDTDTAVTCGAMANAIRKAATSPVIRNATAQALMGAGGADGDKASAIFRWVKGRVQFRYDEDTLAQSFNEGPDKELLISPDMLLSMPQPAGDCDDFTMVVCAMLAAAGIRSQLVTIAADAQQPGRFTHVYAQALLADGPALPLDASHGPYPGWEAPNPFRRATWNIFGVSNFPELSQTLPNSPISSLHGLAGGGMRAYGSPFWTSRDGQGTALGALGADGDITTIDFSQVDPNAIPAVLDGGGDGGSSSVDWVSVLTGGIKTAQTIATSILTRPPAGTYISRGPNGQSVYYRQAAGSSALSIPPLSLGAGGSTFTWLLIGGGVLLAAMMLGGKR